MTERVSWFIKVGTSRRYPPTYMNYAKKNHLKQPFVCRVSFWQAFKQNRIDGKQSWLTRKLLLCTILYGFSYGNASPVQKRHSPKYVVAAIK